MFEPDARHFRAIMDTDAARRLMAQNPGLGELQALRVVRDRRAIEQALRGR